MRAYQRNLQGSSRKIMMIEKQNRTDARGSAEKSREYSFGAPEVLTLALTVGRWATPRRPADESLRRHFRAHVERGSGRSESPPTAILQDTHSVEGCSLLKPFLGTRFRPRLGTKCVGFGAFRARFVVASCSMPTYTTGWWILRSPYPGSCIAAVLRSQKRP